jgi:ATP-binding cassette subfamily B protein
MDTRTERTIQDAIDRLSEGRTTIMIAHRLSTLRNADNLIVIERGKLEEAGSHKELMAKDGIFRRLYNMQLEAMKLVINDE